MTKILTILSLLIATSPVYAATSFQGFLDSSVSVSDRGTLIDIDYRAQSDDVALTTTLTNFKVQKIGEEYEIIIALEHLNMASATYMGARNSVEFNKLAKVVSTSTLNGFFRFKSLVEMNEYVNKQLIPVMGKQIDIQGHVIPGGYSMSLNRKRAAGEQGVVIYDLDVPLSIHKLEVK